MSDNIFADIYNKILGFFGQNVKDESKNTAVNRLRLVLMQDRTNLTPEIMNRMRTELIAVLSKYVELDKEALDLNIGQEGEQMALMLSIPVIRAKDEAEIEEALKKEDEAKAKEESDEDEETEEKTPSETSEDKEDDSEEETSEKDDEDKEGTQDVEESNKEKTHQDDKKEEIKQEPEPSTKEQASGETNKKSIPKIEKQKKEETSEE